MTAFSRPAAAPAREASLLPSRASASEGPGSICACLQARMTARAVTRFYDETLRPTGLKVTQLTLLAAISNGAPPSIRALADLLALERTTLTRNLRLLCDAGLVAPVSGHGRAIAHALTDKGRDALASAAPLWRKAQDSIENGMGPEAWRGARSSLRALRLAASIPEASGTQPGPKR